MRIYNVIQNDRHEDVTATPFLDLEEARRFAGLRAASSSGGYVSEVTVPGCLLCLDYSVEGDSIWITEHDV